MFQILIEHYRTLRKPQYADEKWCTAITGPIVFTHANFKMRLPAIWRNSVSQKGEGRQKSNLSSVRSITVQTTNNGQVTNNSQSKQQ